MQVLEGLHTEYTRTGGFVTPAEDFFKKGRGKKFSRAVTFFPRNVYFL